MIEVLPDDPRMDVPPTIDDTRARELAKRLRRRASEVTEPRFSNIVRGVSNTVFISHTSADDAFINGTVEGDIFPQPGSILWITQNKFYDLCLAN
jgi:hypothetical protein